MIQVKTKNGWSHQSYRVEGNNEWEFITCGTHNLAQEVAALVREQGRTCVVDFSSYGGWYVRIKIDEVYIAHKD